MIKRKKEAKKEKRVAIWKTEGVFHIPTRQTNNNNYYLSLKTKTLHCPAKPSHLTYQDLVLSINLNAQYSYSYLNLGIYYYKNQEFPKALKNLEKAKDLDSETLFVNEFIEKIKSLN